VRNQHANRFRRKRRRDGAALKPPRDALADEQTISKDGPKHSYRGWSSAVPFISVDKHVTDRIGVIQDETMPAEKPAPDNHLLVGSLRKPGESVVPHPRRELESRQILSRWLRKGGITSVHSLLPSSAFHSAPVLKSKQQRTREA